MKEIYLGSTLSITVPSSSTNVAIQHEFGDISFQSVTGGGIFNWTPDSIGTHSLYFINTFIQQTIASPPQPPRLDLTRTSINGSTIQVLETFMNPAYNAITDSTTQSIATSQLSGRLTTAIIQSTNFYDVATRLVDVGQFSSEYPNYDSDQFLILERKIRRFIENYTQQRFGPYRKKTLLVQGEDGNSLPLNLSCLYLNFIVDMFGQDLTNECQISTISPFNIDHQKQVIYYDRNTVDFGYIDRKRDVSYRHGRFFPNKLKFLINGDFGYYFIPNNVVDAATLLIVDQFSGVAGLRDHGIKQASLGDYSYVLGEVDGTTGNIFADRLLSSYLDWNVYLA